MACEAGSLPRAAQIRCDVYARCTKAEGIAMALRCMNPQVIVCDELGTPGDAEAVARGSPPALYSLPRYTVMTRRDCAKSRR